MGTNSSPGVTWNQLTSPTDGHSSLLYKDYLKVTSPPRAGCNHAAFPAKTGYLPAKILLDILWMHSCCRLYSANILGVTKSLVWDITRPINW